MFDDCLIPGDEQTPEKSKLFLLHKFLLDSVEFDQNCQRNCEHEHI